MQSNWILTLLLAHVLGDFYFQISVIDGQKEKDFRKVIIHTLLYAISFVIYSLISDMQLIFHTIFLIPVILHAGINILKYYLVNKTKWLERYIFIIDQFLHVLVIVLTAYVLKVLSIVPVLPVWLKTLLTNFGMKPERIPLIISWVLFILLIGKPANTFFFKMFGHYKPEDDGSAEKKINTEIDTKNPGAVIGFLWKRSQTPFPNYQGVPS